MTLLADKDAVKATIDKYKAVIHSSTKISLLYVMFVLKDRCSYQDLQSQSLVQTAKSPISSYSEGTFDYIIIYIYIILHNIISLEQNHLKVESVPETIV